ncbi:MAG: FAD:protein FMN transferase [Chitinophagales bacterium]|nr:FAD:protein FMN transferase [Chitinophagales bacterium]
MVSFFTPARVLFIACAFPFFSLQAQVTSLQRCTYSHRQMGTLFRVIIYAEDSSRAHTAARELFQLVDSFNTIFSNYQSDSELNKLCARPNERVPVSEPLWQVLRYADRISRKSGGAFDITVGPLSRLWRRARHLQEMPDSVRIRSAMMLVGYQHLRFYRRGHYVLLKKANMQLDLGGIAQGFTADACLKYLKNAGFPAALVDAGGDIVLGAPPPGEAGWKIEVPALHNGQVIMQTVLRSHCGITSSGALYKYLEMNGIRYSHILDPRTGYGLTHHNWVSVEAKNALSADVWATALSVLGKPDKRRSNWLKRHGIKYWITQM